MYNVFLEILEKGKALYICVGENQAKTFPDLDVS
jgi:hypothetical protein